MANNPLDAFEVGQKIGKAKRSTFGMTSDTLMDNFKTGQEAQAKMAPSLAAIGYKEKLERERPLDPLQQSQLELNKAKAEESRNPKSRSLFSFNPQTNEMEQVGTFQKGDIVRNERVPTMEQQQGTFSAQNLRSSADFLLSKLDKDPDMLLKASAPGKFGVDATDRQIYEGLFKEMAAITGGKTLTLGEKQIAKSTLPQYMDVLRSGPERARIASRVSMKVIRELYDRHNARIKSGNLDSVPEFTAQDLMRIQQEAEGEYAQLKGGNPIQKAASTGQGGNIEALRNEAKNAITRGADPQKVANKFRNMTGQELENGG